MTQYSSSAISRFQFCPLSFRYQYDLHLAPKEESSLHHLVFGAAVHKALEVLYRTHDVVKAKETLRAYYPNQLDPNDYAKTADNGCIIMILSGRFFPVKRGMLLKTGSPWYSTW